jgi:hypothetical protein
MHDAVMPKKTERESLITSAQAAQVHSVTGLSISSIRRFLKEGRRPENPLTAAAWDEVIVELGLHKAAK